MSRPVHVHVCSHVDVALNVPSDYKRSHLIPWAQLANPCQASGGSWQARHFNRCSRLPKLQPSRRLGSREGSQVLTETGQNF